MNDATEPINLNVVPWHIHDRFVEIQSRWLTVIGEHLQDHQGNHLEYWRVEKADSVIVIPIQDQQFLLPQPSYRPGVGQAMLDFPGGRLPAGADLRETACDILYRELGIPRTAIASLEALNSQGWAINSSFSNQRLYGWVAEITADSDWNPAQSDSPILRYSIDARGVRSLLQDLTCLQCRSVLQEWYLTTRISERISDGEVIS
ncbi:NUDIX hydrolase [Alkalinema pantanalense CENA528]|uniref:NUDIX hydrolase n=1 Tax=Alkalinema pantanalense TaxID=1620705 RepID=UPI003D6E8E74